MFSINLKKSHFLLVLALLTLSCSNQADPPEPYGPVPTESHLLWHRMEYFSLVCYGLNTYTEVEWAYGDLDPKLFNPSNLDTDQWAQVARDAGMKGLILVAKHHDGFCLWPSKYTEYSVKATPWKNGKGNVLGDLAASCKKYGLQLGVYLSPWDRNHAEYGRPEYVQYYYNQLEELLTGYGDVFEFWIDGANGGTGYYGGADELRTIDRETYYGFEKIFSIVKEHQPDALIFSDVGPGVRWVGNESGYVNETNWNTINTEGVYPGASGREFHKKLGTGDKDGKDWIPAEVNTTLSWPKAWYYHSDKRPRSLANLMDLYYTSIGRGSPLDLGLAIAPTGEIRDMDAKALLKFRQQVDREFRENLIRRAKISSSEHRSKSSHYKADRVRDEDPDTYWATSDGVQKASLTVDLPRETTINRLMMQEYIALGQRIHKFTAEALVDGAYTEFASGTTIGYKRILRFDDLTTSKLRLTFETDAPSMTLSSLGLYNAPLLVDDPLPDYDTEGNLSFRPVEGITTYIAVGEDPEDSDFKVYSQPLHLPLGGRLHYFARDETNGFQTDVIVEELGIAKHKWEVVSLDGNPARDGVYAIDGDPETILVSGENNGGHPHQLIIDLQEEINLGAFSYLPRLDGNKEGMIDGYRFYLSLDGENWGDPVSEGAFNNIENNPVRQFKKLDSGVNARYIKLVSTSAVRQSTLASFSEIDIFAANK
jgi:alpha-L-fucosidase